jgi:hypothetical protein
MSRLSIHELLQYLKENPFLVVRIIILIISFASLITAFGYLSVYTPEVYIRGVPFSVVLRALTFGGLLAVIERFITIYEQIEKGLMQFQKSKE